MIRNLFVHDGARVSGIDFFAGTSYESAFRISDEAWKRIENRVQNEYRVDSSHHRVGANWPTAPTEDLRLLMRVCEREMDDALGILLGSACSSLRAHVGFMLGED